MKIEKFIGYTLSFVKAWWKSRDFYRSNYFVISFSSFPDEIKARVYEMKLEIFQKNENPIGYYFNEDNS